MLKRGVKKFKALYEQYERYLIPGMLVLGVLVDFITFKTIDVGAAFIILFAYLVIAGAVIAYSNIHKAKKSYLFLASPLIIQFTFGALLSASFIFYWFSGAFSVSWPFILLLALLMVANEKFREYYLQPLVQLSLYYFILFSIFSVVFPFLFNSLSAWVFVASGIASILLMYFYLRLLSSHSDTIFFQSFKIKTIVFAVFIFMNLLYFANIIPPIPLALREGGVYHAVSRAGNKYLVEEEKRTFLEKIIPGTTIHKRAGDPVFAYTSIFAPAELRTSIIHNWQYYDEAKREWISRDKLSYRLTGGRREGYRGYSLKRSLTPGLWRVDVETERGQVLGRIKFRVENVEEKPDIAEFVL